MQTLTTHLNTPNTIAHYLIASVFALFVVAFLTPNAEAAPITISGTLYSNEGVTAFTGSSKTIKIAVGTSTLSLHSTTTNSSTGAWSYTFASTNSIGTSTPIVAFIDGATEKAVTFTKAASTSATITGVHLYQGHVILRHEAAGTTTRTTDMAFYDGDDDADIQYTANSNALSVRAGNKLYVWGGTTFAPSGTVTVNGNASSSPLDGSLHLPLSSAYYPGGTTTLAGNFIASTTDFYPTTSPIVFNATTTGKIISATSSSLGPVFFNSMSGGWTFIRAATTSSMLSSVTVNTISASSSLAINGNYDRGNRIIFANSNNFLTVMGDANVTGASGKAPFDNLLIGTQFFGTSSLGTTTDPTASTDGAYAIWGDSNTIYVAGYCDSCGNKGQTAYHVIAYSKSNGGFLWSTTTDPTTGADQPRAIWGDSDTLYVTGFCTACGNRGNYAYHTMAYNKTNGSFRWSTTTDPTASGDYAYAAWGDQDTLYVTGYCASLCGNKGSLAWYTIAYNKQNGSFRWSTTTDPTALGDVATAVWGDQDTLYVTGYCYGCGDEGDDAYHTMAYNKTNGSFRWSTTTDSTIYSDQANAVWGDDIYLYVTGFNGAGAYYTVAYNKVSGRLRGAEMVRLGYGYEAGAQYASTTDLVINPGGNLVAPSNNFTISGNYTNNGTFIAGTGTITFASTSAQTATGTLTGTSALGNIIFTGAGSKTFGANAATSQFLIESSSGAVVAPAELTITGNYTNNGTFTAGSGTTTFYGTSTLSGTMTGTNAFNMLAIGSEIESTDYFSPSVAEGSVWLNPDSIFISDDSYAVGNSLNSGLQWYSFDNIASLVSGNVITSVEVSAEVESLCDGGSDVYVSWDGGGSSNFAPLGESGSGNYYDTAMYGPTLWGHVWDVGDFSPLTFWVGVDSSACTSGDNYIDHLRVRVFYKNSASTTIAASASTTNLSIGSFATATAPSSGNLSISGNYTNSGTFTAGSGTTTFNGTSQQSATGTMTGASAFKSVEILNNTASTTFNAPFTATGHFKAVQPNTKIEFTKNATTTLGTTTITGTSGNEVKLRSTTPGTKWGLSQGTAYSFTSVDVKDSSATNTNGLLAVTSSIDSGNNNGWSFTSAGTRTWDGSNSTSWTLDANWAEGTAPTSADDVVIDGSYTYAPTIDLSGGSITVKSLSIGATASSTLTFSNAATNTNYRLIVTNNVTIGAQGSTTHTANSSSQAHILNMDIGGDLTINAGGAINVNGKGYAGGTAGSTGSGPGGGTGVGSSQFGGGAGHGGNGGNATGAGGITYGSTTMPTSLGSGGGSGNSATGGAGGGAVKLTVSGTATINGQILATGTYPGAVRSGGGAGGSILVTAGTLTGSGAINASGGGGGTDSFGGGGGGGGRIALYYTANTYTGTTTAFGGATGYVKGGAGTIFTKASGATYGDLRIDNGTVSGTTTIEVANITVDNLRVIRNAQYIIPSSYTTTLASSLYGSTTAGITTYSGGTLSASGLSSCSNIGMTNRGTMSISSTFSIGSGCTWAEDVANSTTFSTLTINSGGVLTHSTNTATQVYVLDANMTTLTVDAGGAINVNGKGYAGGTAGSTGSGPGGGTGVGSSQFGGGAGYGGNGGNATNAGGVTYGSTTMPTTLGSGGGSGNSAAGGSGGGAIKLTVSGTATVNGQIVATGTYPGAVRSGGGAGGSILVTAGTLTGSGAINASGGGGGTDSFGGGGGGGGRIALYYTSNTFTGTTTAVGGSTGYVKGGAGTIFMKAAAATYGNLIIDNNSIIGTTTLAVSNITLDNLAVIREAQYIIPNTYTATVTTALTGSSTAGITTYAGGKLSISGISSCSNLIITNRGTVVVPSSFSIGSGCLWNEDVANSTTFTTLTINSGGALSHSTNTVSQTYVLDTSMTTLTIDAGGAIDVRGKGFSGGTANSAGSGTGGGAGGASGQYGAGAGHGGNGGNATGAGGITYGSTTMPTSLGSGGGSGNGNAGGGGGGAIKLTVSGTATVNGEITATGTPGTTRGGGGAGGSILVTAGTLTGSGAINADGGRGGTDTLNGGAGGGGRIALYYTTNTHSGSKTAYGGTSGYMRGGAGTLFTKSTGMAYGDLLIDNSYRVGASTTADASITVDAMTIQNGTRYVAPTDLIVVGNFIQNAAYIAGTNLYFSSTSAQTIAGVLTSSSSLGNVTFQGGGTKTFSNNASTTNFTVSAGTVVAPALLTVMGNFANSGTYTKGTNLYLSSTSAQTISGNLTDTSALGSTTFIGASTKTFSNNASTTGFTIDSGTVVAPTLLSISGNYTNSGTFTAGSGTTTLNGSSQQTATGTLTGTSAFNSVEVLNTASTTFGAPFTATGHFKAVQPNSKIEFTKNATTTLGTTTITGTSGNEVKLRSTTPGTKWGLSQGTAYLFTSVDVKDSSATNTNGLLAVTSSIDSGNNNGWDFPLAGNASISSAANQVFSINYPTTTISTITITDHTNPSITATNDIRIKIATSTVAMKWDTNDTVASFGGSASAKVSGTVSYEGGGSVLVIDVTSNFGASDTLSISGISFSQFTSMNAAATGLSVYTGGASDTSADADDDKTVTITGSLTLADHNSGQVSDGFSLPNDTDVKLMRYKLTPSGENATIATTVFTLVGIDGVSQTDLSNLALYRDINSDGLHDGSDIQVGGAGAVSISGQTGTITFSSSYAATTSQQFILVGDYANISPGDRVTIKLDTSSVTATGDTTLGAIPLMGLITVRQHIKSGGGSSGGGSYSLGPIGGDAPTSTTPESGGGAGGGSGETGGGSSTSTNPETGGGGGGGGGGNGGMISIPGSHFYALRTTGLVAGASISIEDLLTELKEIQIYLTRYFEKNE